MQTWWTAFASVPADAGSYNDVVQKIARNWHERILKLLYGISSGWFRAMPNLSVYNACCEVDEEWTWEGVIRLCRGKKRVFVPIELTMAEAAVRGEDEDGISFLLDVHINEYIGGEREDRGWVASAGKRYGGDIWYPVSNSGAESALSVIEYSEELLIDDISKEIEERGLWDLRNEVLQNMNGVEVIDTGGIMPDTSGIMSDGSAPGRQSVLF